MTGLRVLIVDDSSTVRMILREYLGRVPGLVIAGAAHNGREAVERLEQYAPDVVLLDIEMPELNGLETLPRLKELRPELPVIMFSRLTERGAAETIDALFLGASDYVFKPESRTALEECIETELVPRLRALSGNEVSEVEEQRPESTNEADSSEAEIRLREPDSDQVPVEIVAIAASTGGPRALAELLPLLPTRLPVPLVVVQHMPPGFTATLAQRLDSLTGYSVREASEDQTINSADVWVAPGNRHMIVRHGASESRVQTHDGLPENACRPAADVLFRSVVEVYGAGTLGVVLTGMGNDGLAGARGIVESGGRILIQDEASSAVWGMPGQVARAGLADAILPLSELGREISLRLTRRRPL